MTLQEIITDKQIDSAWQNASFGEHVTKREVIADTLLQYACGYSSGYTIECICRELRLITKQCNLTTLGKQYLYEAFSNGASF